MKGKLKFEIDGSDGQFHFTHHPKHSDPTDPANPDALLDRLSDDYGSGVLDSHTYMDLLTHFVKGDPGYLDASSYLAMAYADRGEHSKALDVALTALTAATSLIPADFKGHIRWALMCNRPFLRVLQGVALAHVHLRQHKEAIRYIKLQMAYNPNDNLGMRYLLGTEQLRAGQIASAKKTLTKYASEYPAYFYELALAHLQEDNWIEAATALRRGFGENPYIAEIMAGNPRPTPMAIWHGNNFVEVQFAVDYLELYGPLWDLKPEWKRFACWVHHHPAVMVERANILSCREELLWEHSVQKRSHILNRLDGLMSAVDDQLSTSLIVKREDRLGRKVHPWLYQHR